MLLGYIRIWDLVFYQFFNWIIFLAAVTSSAKDAVFVESSILLVMSTIISIIGIISMAYTGMLTDFQFICVTESPLKVMKNGFYFILKFLSVLKIFKLLSWLFGHIGLIKKIRLISNFMMSQSVYQTITIHILPNISRIKGNQIMKFGQLIEYNKRNIFL